MKLIGPPPRREQRAPTGTPPPARTRRQALDGANGQCRPARGRCGRRCPRHLELVKSPGTNVVATMLGELSTHRSDTGPGDFGIDGTGLEQAKLANRRIAEQVDLLERTSDNRADTTYDGGSATLPTLDTDRRANMTDLSPAMPCAAHHSSSPSSEPMRHAPSVSYSFPHKGQTTTPGTTVCSVRWHPNRHAADSYLVMPPPRW